MLASVEDIELLAADKDTVEADYTDIAVDYHSADYYTVDID